MKKWLEKHYDTVCGVVLFGISLLWVFILSVLFVFLCDTFVFNV